MARQKGPGVARIGCSSEDIILGVVQDAENDVAEGHPGRVAGAG